MTKDFKMTVVKDGMRVSYDVIDKKIWLFVTEHLRTITGIMTDNIPRYQIFRKVIQFLEHLY